jgi:hypothetical protein
MKMWGRLATCRPISNRPWWGFVESWGVALGPRQCRLEIGPQVTNLPHMAAENQTLALLGREQSPVAGI